MNTLGQIGSGQLLSRHARLSCIAENLTAASTADTAYTATGETCLTALQCPEDKDVWTRVCVFKELAIIDGTLTFLYEGMPT